MLSLLGEYNGILEVVGIFDGGAGVSLSVLTSMLLCSLSLGSGLGMQYCL